MNAQLIINRTWTTIARSQHRLRASQSPISAHCCRTKLQRFHQTHLNRTINESSSGETSTIIDHQERGHELSEQKATVSLKPPTSHPATDEIPAPSGASPGQPWFVDEEPVGSIQGAEEDELQLDLTTSTGPPPPAPTNLPEDLEELYSHLISSPFFDPASIAFIDAKKSPLGDAAWTDWVVLVTLRKGRERAIRGAAEGIQSIVSS
jgi:hypothetical protein